MDRPYHLNECHIVYIGIVLKRIIFINLLVAVAFSPNINNHVSCFLVSLVRILIRSCFLFYLLGGTCRNSQYFVWVHQLAGNWCFSCTLSSPIFFFINPSATIIITKFPPKIILKLLLLVNTSFKNYKTQNRNSISMNNNILLLCSI